MSTCTNHGFYTGKDCPRCSTGQSDVYVLSPLECNDLALWLSESGRAMVMIDNEGFKIKIEGAPMSTWSRGLGTKL